MEKRNSGKSIWHEIGKITFCTWMNHVAKKHNNNNNNNNNNSFPISNGDILGGKLLIGSYILKCLLRGEITSISNGQNSQQENKEWMFGINCHACLF